MVKYRFQRKTHCRWVLVWVIGLFIICLPFQLVQAQVVPDVAPSATPSQGGSPSIQVAPAPGDFVVTDEGADALFAVTPAGVVTTVASGPPFVTPVGVAVDSGGDFIVADFNVGALFRVTPGGVVTTIVAGLGPITGVAIDGGGNFVTVRFAPPAVLRVTPGGVVTTVASGPPFVGLLNQPAIVSGGDIIVTDFGGSALRRVTPGGVVTTIVAGSPLLSPNGVVIDGGGDFIVSDRSGSVFRVTAGGAVNTIASGPPLSRLLGLGLDGSGDVIVTDFDAGALFRVTPGGVVTTIASGPPFLVPNGVAQVGQLPGCTLDMNLSFPGGVFTMDFNVGATEPTTWNVWLSILNGTTSIFSIPLPSIDPAVSFPIAFPLPPLGTVGALTTLTTSNGGIICSNWKTVDTGWR